jgi:hypothetical protein
MDLLMKCLSRIFCIICWLSVSAVSGFSLDREAFAFTNYELHVRLEPEQQRLGVRGKVTLRNDSATPQKLAVLQISSSLAWKSITVGSETPEFLLQDYTSDIDHTGALSEAIVTLPEEIAPRATVELTIGYEGVIPLDATRLTRIGTPEDAANNSDWDQISASFTAVRGAGYVTWYPIATEAANLSEGDSLSEELARWKQRETGSEMKVEFQDPTNAGDAAEKVRCSGTVARLGSAAKTPADHCDYGDISRSVPTFAMANYGTVSRPSITVFNLPTHAVAATTYADVAEQAASVISHWFGAALTKLQVADLPDSEAAPFGSGALLLVPLDRGSSGLAAAYQLTQVAFWSPRPWINEGLAHFAQALYLEQEKGRRSAREYMATHRDTFHEVEATAAAPASGEAPNHSLSRTTDELYLQSKAMSVWWMLRDMVGDAALKKAISLYRPEEDKQDSYMPRLIQAQTARDLGWFFDDWVYHDRGLPDFKVESVYPSQTTTGAYMVTVTVDNLGSAGAEVPVILKFAGGRDDITKRVEVRAKSKATIRVESPSRPAEVVVNDGGVPESDVSNNSFTVEAPQN